MNSNDHDNRTDLMGQPQGDADDRAEAIAESAEPTELLEGQLGPDELPDPGEVQMNQAAKLHH